MQLRRKFVGRVSWCESLNFILTNCANIQIPEPIIIHSPLILPSSGIRIHPISFGLLKQQFPLNQKNLNPLRQNPETNVAERPRNQIAKQFLAPLNPHSSRTLIHPFPLCSLKQQAPLKHKNLNSLR